MSRGATVNGFVRPRTRAIGFNPQPWDGIEIATSRAEARVSERRTSRRRLRGGANSRTIIEREQRLRSFGIRAVAPLGRVSEEMSLGASRAARKWVLAVVLVVAGVAAIEFLRTSSRRFVHEASGTVVAVDPAARTAKLEMIDPANGATRQFDGAIPETCTITLNGRPAALADLRVGDAVQVRVRIERHGSRSDRNRKTLTTAEAIDIQRTDEGSRK